MHEPTVSTEYGVSLPEWWRSRSNLDHASVMIEALPGDFPHNMPSKVILPNIAHDAAHDPVKGQDWEGWNHEQAEGGSPGTCEYSRQPLRVLVRKRQAPSTHLPPIYVKRIRPVTNVVPEQFTGHSTIPGALQTSRIGLPVETMLPRLRAGEPVDMIPSEEAVAKKGIYPLIDRGFVPHDADYSRFLSPDHPERVGVIWNKPSVNGSNGSVRPFLRHVQAKIHDFTMRFEQPDTVIRLTGLYEPALRLASAAERMKSVNDEMCRVVDRKRSKDKQTISTKAPVKNWNMVRPSLRPRPSITFLPPSLPPAANHHEVRPSPLTPAPSFVLGEQISASSSDVNLFTADEIRAETINVIRASREGAIIVTTGGEVQVQARGFLEFQKNVGEDGWGAVEWVLRKFEKLMTEYAVPYAEIMSKPLLSLAACPVRSHFTSEELLACIVNATEVYRIIKTEGQRYRGSNGREAAARKIQATFRMWIMRRIQMWYRDRVWAANIFVKYWKRRKMRFSFRRMVETQYHTVHVKRHQRLLATYKRDIATIMAHKRIIIQLVPSKQLGELQDPGPEIQIGRAIMLGNPDVETIFVTPYVDEDRINYFKQVLATGFPERNPVDENRIRFVVPEAARCFPNTAPLASMLLASKRALNKLRNMCQGRNAVLLCDAIGKSEVTLSSTLSVPLFGPTPSAYSRYLSTRSRSREYLRSAGLPVAPALKSHTADEHELCLQLVKAISMHADVPLWCLFGDPVMNKVEESELEGPEACLDPSNLTFVKNLYEPLPPSIHKPPLAFSRPISGKAPPTPATAAILASAAHLRPTTAPPVPHVNNRPATPRRGMIAAHLSLARREIPLHTRVLSSGSTWSEFICRWMKHGGIVHAFPSRDPREVKMIEIGIVVDFEGKYDILIMADVLLHHANLSPTALIVPYTSDTQRQQDLAPMLAKIASKCASDGIAGPLSVQFLTWIDPSTGDRKYWATQIRPFTSPTLLRAATVLLATGCKPDSRGWKVTLPKTEIPFQVRYARSVRFLDQAQLRSSFQTKQMRGMSPNEPRVALYIYGLEHGQVATMTRAAAVATALNNGLRYDFLTRTGMLYPEQDATWGGILPFISIAHSYESLLETTLLNLLHLNRLLDECASESGARYRNNFMAVAVRLLYELLAYRPMHIKTSDQITGCVPVAVQAAFKHLGLTLPGVGNRRSVARHSTPPTPDIRHSRCVASNFSEDDQTSSEPESDVEEPLDPIYNSPSTTRPFLVQSAAPTTSSDLEVLLSYFMTVPIFTSRPSTVSSARSRSRTAKPKKSRRRRRAFSPTTAALLAEEIPSNMAAKHDNTFQKPLISPPFSRRASAQRAKAMEGRSKRARLMLEKIEKEMETLYGPNYFAQDISNLSSQRSQKKAGKVVAKTGLHSRRASESSRVERTRATTQITPAMDEDNESSESDEDTHEGTHSSVRESNVKKIGRRQSLTVQSKEDVSVDMETVLMKLQDLAERGERITAIIEERTKQSQKKLEESHRKHLEMLEQKRSEEEARAAQKALLEKEAELAATRGRFVIDAGTGQKIEGKPGSPLRPARSVPILANHSIDAESRAGDKVPLATAASNQKQEPNKIATRRISDLVTDVMGEMFARERRTSVVQRVRVPRTSGDKQSGS
ncbi:uncharacterized protein SPPG_03869 [Spizellomyces punctatus DAOM BR117]|uniref:IQCH-like ATP-grasp domain-containing protein n=1 Tax=Spizellomyces punctatus (strain DAOM BR117) TaxID=645134 RepID=A0A0L0HH13_SPIPD|nr:uncharacterized protein SPPG_03869 [Spizellomyces punctatus DAOM BR117]KND00756.1 hypothetical protein SPPG_03869 [Spizellomyces punctatus DAOM BR117]|eukprot:XP_016608795.1 hypothetical protein SPPG_03869 [Spizellomyces punctatus DAOM BR117]